MLCHILLMCILSRGHGPAASHRFVDRKRPSFAMMSEGDSGVLSALADGTDKEGQAATGYSSSQLLKFSVQEHGGD